MCNIISITNTVSVTLDDVGMINVDISTIDNYNIVF